MPAELQRCLAVGCDAYATKPIDRRLLELAARYAERASQTPANTNF